MRFLWLPVLIVVLMPSCEMTQSVRPSEGDMLSVDGIQVQDIRVIWEIVKLEAERSGFQLDRDATSMRRGEFETRWRMELAPFRYQGRRKKMLGFVREIPEGSRTFSVRVTTWVQQNADIADPMDPTKAIWQDIEPDVTTSEELLRRIKRHFPDSSRDGM